MNHIRTKVMARARSWWKALTHRREMESELESELRFHVDAFAADLVRQGMPADEAQRRARMELGTMAAQKEQVRSSVGLRSWDDFRADVRYAFRQLRRTPAFTVTVLVVLALGIGFNAAMFSIIDATLLRWLPYRHPGELVRLNVTDSQGSPSWIFYADLLEWQKQAHSMDSLAYYNDVEGFLETKAGQESVSAQKVSANLFDVLGVQPKRGRAFAAEEQVPGNNKVVTLSDAVWRTMLQADPEVVGKQIRLNDQPYTVVGVMPPGFEFPANDSRPQIWMPAEVNAASQTRSFAGNTYQAIVRLRRGATPASVSAELTGVQSNLAPLYKKEMIGEFPPLHVNAVGYRESLVAGSRPALLALVAAVGILWLIACANVANLMLARGMARQREVAVRGALGASRGRIIRQLFTESLVLSLLGSAAGLGLAQLALRIFSRTLSVRLNLPEELTPNPAVLGALLALSVISALLFGLLPAWLAARIPLEQSLRQASAQAGTSRSRHRLQQAMVVAEIGLSLVLLVACGLMLRTVFTLRKVPLGFRTDHVLMVQPKLPRYKYRGIDANRVVYQPLVQRIQQMPGVRSASLTTLVPLQKGFSMVLTLYVGGNQKTSAPPTRIDASLKAVGPELQDVLGFSMARGRFFNQQDTPDSPVVAVVNRAFAQLYLPSGDVMEKLKLSMGKGREIKIVGVMDDFHQASIDAPAAPEIDICATQLRATDGFYQPTLQAHVEMAVRTQTDPQQFVPELRHAMLDLNPDLQTSTFQTMSNVVEESMGSQLLAARLLELFGATALLVALAGLYGLLTYLVAQRHRELGVRLALGAQRGAIVQMLLRQAARLLATGAVAGVVLAYFSTRLLSGFLYGVKPHDVWTMIGVTTLLLLCGLLASYVPATRASRVDPLVALRGD